MPPALLRLIGFPTGTQLPLVVAQDRGFFAARDLEVTLTATPGSAYQFEQLSAGNFELAMTALDNVIAYDEGQTEAALPRPADFVMILGGDGTAPALWVAPGVDGYADLRGATLAVDATTSGFSFLLRGMLERHGLARDDYAFTPVGTTARRLEALRSGAAAGALLDPAFAAAASAAGLRVLERGNDALGPYGAFGIAASRTWLEANRGVTARFVSAVREGIEWLLAPENHAEAIGMLTRHLHVEEPQATAIFAQLVDPAYGFSASGEIPEAALRTIFRLRETYGEPKKTLGPPERYYDRSFARMARGD